MSISGAVRPRHQGPRHECPCLPTGTRQTFDRLAGVGALLSVGIGLASYRYVIHIGPVPPNIRANAFVHPWIIIHAGAAATALLCGAIQLQTKLLRRWPACHRWIGRAYVAGCLIGGAAGLVLSAGVSTGPVAKAGFGALGALWIYTTAKGWRSARAGRWAEHGQWMVRSFALAFGAVTLRLYMPTALVLSFSFPDCVSRGCMAGLGAERSHCGALSE